MNESPAPEWDRCPGCRRTWSNCNCEDEARPRYVNGKTAGEKCPRCGADVVWFYRKLVCKNARCVWTSRPRKQEAISGEAAKG